MSAWIDKWISTFHKPRYIFKKEAIGVMICLFFFLSHSLLKQLQRVKCGDIISGIVAKQRSESSSGHTAV